MVRLRALAASTLLLALLMAGCSQDKDYAPLQPAAPAPAATTTETLHLLEGGALGTQAPSGAEPKRLTVMSIQANEDGATSWTFTWPTNSDRVTGRAHLVVSVDGLVVNPQAEAVERSCFWALQIFIQDGDPQTDDGGGAQVCVDEPRVVPTGVRTLDLPFELVGDGYAAGVPARITLLHLGSEAADAKVELLTASAQHDSTVAFDGIEWPMGLARVP